jgi:hypothetical protein
MQGEAEQTMGIALSRVRNADASSEHFGASGRLMVQEWCAGCRSGRAAEGSVDDFVSLFGLAGGLANNLHANDASWPDVTKTNGFCHLLFMRRR